MRFLFLTMVMFLSVFFVFSAEPNGKIRYTGFSGGMMLHTGYIKGSPFDIYGVNHQFIKKECIEGFASGIGGRLAFHFNDRWRVGSEGYSTSVSYGKNHYKIGWGGVNFEYFFHLKKFTPFIGFAFGGGSSKNTIVLQEASKPNLFSQAVYKENSFMLINPTLGVEYSLTAKIRLVLKTDYMVNLSKSNTEFSSGIRCYIGVVFARFN